GRPIRAARRLRHADALRPVSGGGARGSVSARRAGRVAGVGVGGGGAGARARTMRDLARRRELPAAPARAAQRGANARGGSRGGGGAGASPPTSTRRAR